MLARTPRFIAALSSCLLLAALALPGLGRAQCVSLTTLGSASTQNFDTLSNTAGSTTNNLTITGWFMTESGGGARDNEQYAVDTGASNTGDTFSYGAAAATERALGGLQSGTLIPLFGACYTNNTGATIGALSIAYNGEQWRISNTAAARDDRLDFQYSLNATDLVTGTWVDANALDFTNPIKTAAAAAALDGNAAANRTATSSTVPALSIANGATFWIRWTDLNASGADDALAVDDFSLTPQAAVVPPNLTINDVSANEGNAGTTNFTFTVGLSAPAPAGGVTFDIATADGTAVAPGDYVVNSLTGQTIPAGSSTYSFTVLVNGDLTPEANETFFVNVTNATGATVTDGQGQGTISNDDIAATPNLSIDDVSLNEGNAGTSSFTFTVSLAAPAGAGGATFDIATADGTAVAPGDYTAKSLTGQTIPAGSSTYSFTVLVNGDTAVETNETFLVNVTNITGATGVDTQGSGTIVNDDVAPNLTINDVTLPEGNAGTTAFNFTVALSAPAGVGGVSFDIATADGTAVAPGDYTARTLTAQTIPAGSSTYSFSVNVNGDTTVEGNETFLVNLTNVVNAVATDGQGLGTINNDDFTPIHDIQGPGAASPITGTVVTTRGIVTGRRSNGFFIQEPDASVDADPATSEGILVFTSSAPPATAAVGNLVQVTGTVVEFVPAADPQQPPLTELSSPTVTQISTGNALPAAITLTTSNPSPAGAHDQLERYEAMRVSVPSFTVFAPSGGTLTETAATSVGNGVFQGVVTGNARAFREAGIQAPDTPPAGTIPPIPRFDSNPEVIRVDSDGLTGGPLLNVNTGTVLTNLVGPLDYTFRRYTILPDPASPPTVAGGVAATAVTAAIPAEVTISAYNMQRFYDTVDDPATSDVVLTSGAFTNRLIKASLGIRDFLRTPDIVAVVEMENLTTLQALAARISSDALAASQPDPLYQPYLIEGNDIGGIDVGFLVKTAPVVGNTPRVTVIGVTQELASTQFINADNSTELLNDRPPLRLTATINNATGQSWPVTVIANHLRSLNNANDSAAGTLGWATVGARVRAKRQAQAVDLANLVQARQLATPSENIVLVGDFNAFEVNDGLGDSMGTIQGTPAPDNQTAVPGDGADLVTPDLTNLHFSPPAVERYSYVFDGNAQSLDHVLVNAAVIASTSARRIEHPRINADFAESLRGGAAATRLADHDPIVMYASPLGFQSTDLAITKTDSPDPVTAGSTLTYTITATNSGAINAAAATISDVLAAGTTFQSINTVGGWTCVTPAVGATGTVNCSNASFAPGSAVFTLVVNVAPTTTAGTVISNTATIATSTPETSTANNSATATSTVATAADLSVTVTDSADPVIAGTSFSYTLALTHAGPSNAAAVSLADTLPAGTTFVSLTSPGGWSCTTPAVGATGTVNCSIASLAPGTASFTLTVAVDIAVAGGTVLSNTATVSSTTTDPTPGDNSDTETTTVNASVAADIALTLTDSPDPVTAGTQLSYVATVSNAGPAAAAAVTVNLPLPAGTSFVSGTVAGGGSCAATAGTVTCSYTGVVAAGGGGARAATIVVDVAPSVLAGSSLTATASATTSNTDGNAANNSATTSTVVAATANLAASVTLAPTTVALGGTVAITATIANNGPSDAQSPQLVVTLPTGMVALSAVTLPGGTCTQASPVNCQFSAALAPGSQQIVTIQARVDTALAAPVTAVASSATSDPVPANNSAQVRITVLGNTVQIPATDLRGLLVLLGLLTVLGSLSLRRRS